VPPLAFAGRGCQAAGRADGWPSGRLTAGRLPVRCMEKQTPENIHQTAALLLHNWRFLRQDQLVALLELGRDDHGLLDELDAAGVARRFTNPLSASGDSIYALGARGAAIVASALGVDRARLRASSQRTTVKPLFLDHLLHINDIRLAFHLASTHQPGGQFPAGQAGVHPAGDCQAAVRLVSWLYDRQAADRLPDPSRPGEWVAIRPDGYLVYHTPGRQLHAFVEADLGTVANKRWAARVQAYVMYRLSGAFRRRFGTSSFRVLTVTTTPRRLSNLLRTTEKAGGKSLFWFTTWADLRAHSPLSAIWSVAGSGAACSATGSSGAPSSPTVNNGKRGSMSRGPPADGVEEMTLPRAR